MKQVQVKPVEFYTWCQALPPSKISFLLYKICLELQTNVICIELYMLLGAGSKSNLYTNFQRNKSLLSSLPAVKVVVLRLISSPRCNFSRWNDRIQISSLSGFRMQFPSFLKCRNNCTIDHSIFTIQSDTPFLTAFTHSVTSAVDVASI